MRKDNYVASVMIITPHRGAVTGNEARHTALNGPASQVDRIDVWRHEAYFSLRIRDVISDGKGATVKAGSKGRGSSPRRRAQSASRSCPRSIVRGQPVLRPQGSRPSPLRDGAPSSGRWAVHKQCRRYLRGLTPDFLQSPERFGRPRPRWTASAAARTQGRAQDLSRSHRLRRRAEGNKARSHAAAGHQRNSRSFWPRRPSTKSGAGAQAQKKTTRLSVAANTGRVVDAYERLRAGVVGAQQIPGAGLATLRRQGMAAWIKASDSIPGPTSPLPAARRPPTAGAIARNELTLILASLVVTLSAEPTHA
jgi:hypothetical protein